MLWDHIFFALRAETDFLVAVILGSPLELLQLPHQFFHGHPGELRGRFYGGQATIFSP